MNLVPNIFKIDRTHRLLVGIDNLDDTCQIIIKEYYKKNTRGIIENDYVLQKYKKGNVVYHLFSSSVEDKLSEWARFLPDELIPDIDTFYQTKIFLVLFIETEYGLYALVGGGAYVVIVNFIDHQFGLSLYDRIISLDGDEAMSTKSRGITGQRVGMSEQFRDEFKLINFLQFGKIPKELNIKLKHTTAYNHFGFLLDKPTERFTITVGKAFKINRQVDFNSLHRVIEELSVIHQLAPQELLSSYIEVKSKAFIQELQLELGNKIYNNIPVLLGTSKRQEDYFEFDFCSPNNLEAFYNADTYQLKEKDGDRHVVFATLMDRNDIYKTVVLRAYETCGNDQQSFLYYLRGVKVNAYKGSTRTTGSMFLFHLNAEITHNGESVFLIDTRWYKVKDSFIKSLNVQTKTIFKSFRLSNNILHKKWLLKEGTAKLEDEANYNMLYEGKQGYIVMDTVTPDGVEICDLLYISNGEIFLIHIKHSFTARVRELTNQIEISARRVSEAVVASNRSFFMKAYDFLVRKGRSVDSLTKDEFTNLFFERKINYVFATASQFTDNASIETNLGRYRSNIAKFSLSTCSAEIRTLHADLLVCQILRA